MSHSHDDGHGHDHNHHDHSHEHEHADCGSHGHQGHNHSHSHGHPHGHGHGHHHGHGHGHGHHGHHHGPANYNKAFAIGILLNTGFVILEALYGLWSSSLALLADAGHNLSDVLALLLAWGASALAKKLPSKQRTYGYRRSSILAALFNALLLLIAIGLIAWEALHRLGSPEPVAGSTVIWIAAVGIAINAFTAWMFMSGSKGDLNIRGAYLHMAADAAVSLGVVIAGFIILQTDWYWIDPLVSLVIVAVIFWGTWGLLKDSVNMALDAVPPGIDPTAVAHYLAALPDVTEVHDLHIWGMSTTDTALTAHLVVAQHTPGNELLRRAARELQEKFGIGHATLQLETAGYACQLAPDDQI